MQIARSSTPRTIFRDAFRAFMRYCGGRDCSKGVGVLILRRNSLLARARNSIASADPIRIFRMTRLYRSISMNGFANIVLLMLFVSGAAAVSDPAMIESVYATRDIPLHLDPASNFWRASRPVYMEKDSFGKIVSRYRTEVRTRWTTKNLYFLFVCPYEELHLKPAPNTQKETNKLWNWDVAEVFIGSDFANIN